MEKEEKQQHDSEDEEKPSIFYSVQDTIDGCYRDVSLYLKKQGWKPINYKKKPSAMSKIEKKIYLLKKHELPTFVWTINEKDINFPDLQDFQIVNHFNGITSLTTKMGLCDLLRESSWVEMDSTEICPRTFNLGDPIQRHEFVKDFRLTAAINLVKWLGLPSNKTSTFVIDSNISKLAFKAVSTFLQEKYLGQWWMSDPSADDLNLNSQHGLSNEEWSKLLDCSYDLAIFVSDDDLISFYYDGFSQYRCDDTLTQIKARMLINQIAKFQKQFFMSGSRNIWVMKAPEACRGLNINLSCNLDEILNTEKIFGSRTVQKYVERPLLICPRDNSSSYFGKYYESSLVKFDIRVWVLVTSFDPLIVYIHNVVYGRRCSLYYRKNVQCLDEMFMHLTNFSVQKKHGNTNDGNNNNNPHQLQKSISVLEDLQQTRRPSVQKLRKSVSVNRSEVPGKKPENSNASSFQGSDLIVSFDQIMNLLTIHYGSKAENIWQNKIWPQIKQKIYSILEIAAQEVTHRDNSFEFLGVDVLLDENCVPWILEVNMSPGLSHSKSQEQNEMIESMIRHMMEIAVVKSTSPDANTNAIGCWERVYPLEREVNVPLHPHPVSTTTGKKKSLFRQWTEAAEDESRSLKTKPTVVSRIKSMTLSASASGSDLHKYEGGERSINLTLTGSAVSQRFIKCMDDCCLLTQSLLMMQRWSRKMLHRCKLYHERRKHAAIMIQCATRCFQSRQVLHHLVQNHAAIILQCMRRRHAAKLKRRHLFQCKKATIIQKYIRRFLAKLRRLHLYRCKCKSKIWKWYSSIRRRIRNAAATKITRICKKWLLHRNELATIVQFYIKKYFYFRKKKAQFIKRWMKACLFRKHLEQSRRKRILMRLAYNALAIYLERTQRIEKQKQETVLKEREDERGYALREYYKSIIPKRTTNNMMAWPQSSTLLTQVSEVEEEGVAVTPIPELSSPSFPLATSKSDFDLNDFISKYTNPPAFLNEPRKYRVVVKDEVAPSDSFLHEFDDRCEASSRQFSSRLPPTDSSEDLPGVIETTKPSFHDESSKTLASSSHEPVSVTMAAPKSSKPVRNSDEDIKFLAEKYNLNVSNPLPPKRRDPQHNQQNAINMNSDDHSTKMKSKKDKRIIVAKVDESSFEYDKFGVLLNMYTDMSKEVKSHDQATKVVIQQEEKEIQAKALMQSMSPFTFHELQAKGLIKPSTKNKVAAKDIKQKDFNQSSESESQSEVYHQFVNKANKLREKVSQKLTATQSKPCGEVRSMGDDEAQPSHSQDKQGKGKKLPDDSTVDYWANDDFDYDNAEFNIQYARLFPKPTSYYYCPLHPNQLCTCPPPPTFSKKHPKKKGKDREKEGVTSSKECWSPLENDHDHEEPRNFTKLKTDGIVETTRQLEVFETQEREKAAFHISNAYDKELRKHLNRKDELRSRVNDRRSRPKSAQAQSHSQHHQQQQQQRDRLKKSSSSTDNQQQQPETRPDHHANARVEPSKPSGNSRIRPPPPSSHGELQNHEEGGHRHNRPPAAIVQNLYIPDFTLNKKTEPDRSLNSKEKSSEGSSCHQSASKHMKYHYEAYNDGVDDYNLNNFNMNMGMDRPQQADVYHDDYDWIDDMYASSGGRRGSTGYGDIVDNDDDYVFHAGVFEYGNSTAGNGVRSHGRPSSRSTGSRQQSQQQSKRPGSASSSRQRASYY